MVMCANAMMMVQYYDDGIERGPSIVILTPTESPGNVYCIARVDPGYSAVRDFATSG
jgi:hypothetical protein